MAHAVGGSLGSALALLLLYPLERARVEMQTMTATAAATRTAVNGIHGKVRPLTEAPPHPHQTPGGSGGLDKAMPSLWDASWEASTLNEEKDTDMSILTGETSFKSGLLDCIYQLHQRNQLYRGVTPVVTTMALSNFVFFYAHSYLKKMLLMDMKSSSSGSSNLRLSLLASCLAGIANVLVTNPFWVANLRIITKSESEPSCHSASLWSEIKSILQEEGWKHLWNGTPASLLLVSNPVIQFVAYEQFKNSLQSFYQSTQHVIPSNGHNSIRPLEAFLLGALAKAISTVLTYPLQLAQTVLRAQIDDPTTTATNELARVATSVHLFANKSSTDHSTAISSSKTQEQQPTLPTAVFPHPTYKGTLDCLIQIYRQKGLEGWFTGMKTKLLQTVLTAAFTFLTYEQIIRALMAVHTAWHERGRIRTMSTTNR